LHIEQRISVMAAQQLCCLALGSSWPCTNLAMAEQPKRSYLQRNTLGLCADKKLTDAYSAIRRFRKVAWNNKVVGRLSSEEYKTKLKDLNTEQTRLQKLIEQEINSSATKLIESVRKKQGEHAVFLLAEAEHQEAIAKRLRMMAAEQQELEALVGRVVRFCPPTLVITLDEECNEPDIKQESIAGAPLAPLRIEADFSAAASGAQGKSFQQPCKDTRKKRKDAGGKELVQQGLPPAQVDVELLKMRKAKVKDLKDEIRQLGGAPSKARVKEVIIRELQELRASKSTRRRADRRA
jgi:uncharacterized protein YdcH (DUF465 family)